MQKWIIPVIALLLSAQAYGQGSYAQRVEAYIKQYRDLAIAEQKRSGIPASIILAQGIHETQAGGSELATMANNHFGIKCKKEWKGETFAHTDDAPNECFRKYGSAYDSYIDHSDYLVKTPRYSGLFKNSITDYAAWAVGLRQAGYATNPKYAQVLIKIIEDYRLQEYTYAALNNNLSNTYAANTTTAPAQEARPVSDPVATPAATSPASGGIKVSEGSDMYPQYGQTMKVNGVRAVFARKGDTPLEYALKYNIRYERLLENNDISDKPLPYDMYIYLERKLFTGTKPYYTVEEGETLHQIAQKESIQMKFLRAMNLLEEGEEPAPGAKLYLQRRTDVKPEIIASTRATPVSIPAETKPATIAEAKPVTAIAKTETPKATPVEEKPAQEKIVEAINTDITPAIEQVNATTQAPAIVKTAAISKPVESATPVQSIEPVKQEENAPEIATPREGRRRNRKAETPKPEIPQEPVDELDALKARFDKAIYTSNNTGAGTEANSEPATQPQEPAKEQPKLIADNSGAKYHIVKKGDTAFSITKQYNITMRQLMDWNNMNFETIKLGQKLRVKE
jgi:LysM repeat protein